ncbi:MAG: outer membrane beta-barrel protein [Chitinophagaceae bacterium]|nr:outer membrane beta-barrel protein [Chitinophagaceae bacterium]
MRIIFTILLLFIIFSVPASAQKTTIRVALSVNKADSFPPATIQLYSLPDTLALASQLAKAAGNLFAVNSFTKYVLKISSSGFAETEKMVAVTDKSIAVTVPMKKKIKGLDEVVVVSKKPLVRQEDDKQIIDAEALANSSSNAYEVLEKTPGAIVDQDGNVYLNSMTPASIQINGRDIKLSAADLASLLKSLPSGSVSKIEILRNPSAKYDAASSGGIVNIVLKKGVKIGSSGSMNVGYFQGVYNTKLAGFNINKGGSKATSYFSYQYTDKNNFEELNSTRLLSSSNSLLSQKAQTTYPAANHYFGLGTDITLTKKFSLAYDLRISANDGRSIARNDINILNSNESLTGNNASSINNHNTSIYTGNNISTKFKIDSAGSEWTMQFDFNRYNYNNEQLYNNYYYLPAAPALYGNGINHNRKNIFAAQTDLTWKLKHGFTVETGFKTSSSGSNNSADYFLQQGASAIKVDSFQTNTFRYTEKITSAYLQVSKKIVGLIIKPGVRMEATNISGRQLIPFDTSLSIKRTDFFPYLYLRHRIMKMFGFELNGNAILRRSITRPYYEILNPYPKYIDQYLFDVGNPNLQPQFTNNYEFNITADDFTIFSVGVNNTKNIFSNVTYQDEQTGIAYRTYDNLGTSKEVYLRFVGGIPPGGKYFFYAGAQQNINSYNGFYQGVPLNYKRNSWIFFMYHQLKLMPALTMGVYGFMRTKGLQNFYELQNFGALNVNFNKSIMNKTANIILSFNDILLTNKTEFRLQQGNVNAFGTRVNDTRRIGITFRYNFGIKPKEEKKPLFEQPADNRDN